VEIGCRGDFLHNHFQRVAALLLSRFRLRGLRNIRLLAIITETEACNAYLFKLHDRIGAVEKSWHEHYCT
jgi:hypothetical protein